MRNVNVTAHAEKPEAGLTLRYCSFGVPSMSSVASAEFEQATSYALERLKCSDLKLNSEQVEAIRHVYGGRDVFVWLPTGFGKSICDEVLSLTFDYRSARSRVLATEAAGVRSAPSLVNKINDVF